MAGPPAPESRRPLDERNREIENALDRAEIVLALLSDGSFKSDICRAEQGWALDAGKRVIPVKVHRDSKAQLQLHGIQWLDFSDPAKYAERFQELLESIGKSGPAAVAPTNPQPRYNNAPPLPDNFVPRPEIQTALRNALFANAPNRNIALTALQGMGGIGKTVLAQALCHDEVVRHAYPDGIFWFTIGKESRLTFDQRIEAVPGLAQLIFRSVTYSWRYHRSQPCGTSTNNWRLSLEKHHAWCKTNCERRFRKPDSSCADRKSAFLMNRDRPWGESGQPELCEFP